MPIASTSTKPTRSHFLLALLALLKLLVYIKIFFYSYSNYLYTPFPSGIDGHESWQRSLGRTQTGVRSPKKIVEANITLESPSLPHHPIDTLHAANVCLIYLERSQANSILSRTHTITSLGHLLEFAAEWVGINGRPTNSAEYGLLLKAFEKTEVISLILHKIDIFVAWQTKLFNPRRKWLAGDVGGEQIERRWPLPYSWQCPRRHSGRYSVRHRPSPCTDLHRPQT